MYRKTLLIIILIVAMVTSVTGCFIPARVSYRESQVDASCVADLDSSDIGRMLLVIERMENEGEIIAREIKDQLGHPQLLEIHSFTCIKYAGVWVRVSVDFFETEQGAIDFFPSVAMYRNSEQQPIRTEDGPFIWRPCSFFMYDNGAEVFLGDSGRNANEYGYTTSWTMSTNIRLENINIQITEERSDRDFHAPATSEFIKQLCEMLKEGNN